MQSQLVFESKAEIERLRVQNDLLSGCEAPVLAQLLSGRQSLSVLDIGCNSGRKTVERFSSPAVSRVIGLEYHPALAEQAQRQFGDAVFSFFPMDVEAADFSAQLRTVMQKTGVAAFDVICLSFLLMHLSDPGRLLRALRPFLSPGGKLLIIEANDSACTLEPDPEGLLDAFLGILRDDPYSGNRRIGAELPGLLTACGYGSGKVWQEAISAGREDRTKKQAIYTTFFSYLPEDVRLLLEANPENRTYRTWSDWLERNGDTMKQLILGEDSVISMGIRILTCTGDGT